MQPGPALLLSLLVLGCEPDARLRWEVSFETEALAAPTSIVMVELREGGCSAPRWAGYGAELSPGETPPSVPALRASTWGFAAFARNASCERIAQGCTELALPAAETVVVTTLRGVTPSPDCSPADCAAGVCTEPIPPRDAGLDAGTDAGSDASTCSCTGRTCGDDGCGTTCGTCGPGSMCESGVCVACATLRDSCSSDPCCEGLECAGISGLMRCCASVGGSCMANFDCCAPRSVCTDGSCCAGEGGTCSSSSECCNDSCTDGICCVGLDEACSGGAGCCGALDCDSGRCCVVPGDTCRVTRDCCGSGRCEAARCCAEVLEPCSAGRPCCSGLSCGTSGVCCRPPGATCSMGAQCCSVSCTSNTCD